MMKPHVISKEHAKVVADANGKMLRQGFTAENRQGGRGELLSRIWQSHSRPRLNGGSAGGSLFIAQCGEGIGLHGPASGKNSGQNAQEQHNGQNDSVIFSVAGRYSVQKVSQQRSDCQREEKSCH
jgi:hypothetical protein